jgi:lipopolysaccharide biosynthesis glycosyltransferase
MKICLYTISDLNPISVQCVDMLYDSIFSQKSNTKNNIDFYVVSNKLPTDYIKYNCILSEFNNAHIVYSRYTSNLPSGYDKYIYLDSDILFFDDLLSLIDDRYEFGLVTEGTIGDMNGSWWKYPFSTEEDIKIFNSLTGINSGTFVVSDKEYLVQVAKLFIPYLHLWQTQSDSSNAMFEQSCFNYFIAKKCGIALDNCYLLTDKVELHCADKPPSHKKIYHFTGFGFGMKKKLEYMQKFKLLYENQYNNL